MAELLPSGELRPGGELRYAVEKQDRSTGEPGAQRMERKDSMRAGCKVWSTPYPARGPGPAAGTPGSEKLLWLRPRTQHYICIQRVWAGSMEF